MVTVDLLTLFIVILAMTMIGLLAKWIVRTIKNGEQN